MTIRTAPRCAFVVDGAPLPADAGAYQRVVLIFDGEDPDALAAPARTGARPRSNGFQATYWQADEQGRWRRQE